MNERTRRNNYKVILDPSHKKSSISRQTRKRWDKLTNVNKQRRLGIFCLITLERWEPRFILHL